jgi:hypothetical protein
MKCRNCSAEIHMLKYPRMWVHANGLDFCDDECGEMAEPTDNSPPAVLIAPGPQPKPR